MQSPPQSPREHSRRRPALHERSDSQANQKGPPSLRVVGEPDASIYDTTPFPTKPSHILRPSRPNRGLRPTIGTTPSQPPGGNSWNSWASTSPAQVQTSRGEGWTEQGSKRNSHRSSTDVSIYSTSPDLSASEEVQELNTKTSFLHEEEEAEHAADEAKVRVSGDSVVQLPSVPPRAKGHSVPTSVKSRSASVDRQPANKESDSSLNSTNSTGTVVVKKTRDGKKRASYSAFPFPRPSSSKSSLNISIPPKGSRAPSDGEPAPVSPVSPSSPVSATFEAYKERRISSLPSTSSTRGDDQTSTQVQYPVIKPQSVSASWAESTFAPPIASRSDERLQGRWNPHLSTVHSEGTSSFAGERSSQGTGLFNSSRVSKSSSNLRSDPRSSTDYPPVPMRSPHRVSTSESSQGYSSMPSPTPSSFPFPAPIRQRDESRSSIRVVSDPEIPVRPAPARTRDVSGTSIRLVTAEDQEPAGEREPYATGRNTPQALQVASEDRLRNSPLQPGSRASFFRESIPAWAKTYYKRPNSSATFSRPDSRRMSTSTDDISLNVYRTRPTLPLGKPRELRRSKMRIGPRPGELDLAETVDVDRRRFSPSWSPHLYHHRTSIERRRSVFIVPSIEARAEGRALTRRNAQNICFVIGFIMPPAWLLASLLPLPDRPALPDMKGKGNIRNTEIMESLEKQLGPIDDARYENARWWRNLNRLMSMIGGILIITIIILAVVGAS